jgi:polyhydroxyalkanoate synthesis regulator phasin
MKDILKKAMFMGLGAASITKEKIKTLTDDLVTKGKVSADEGEKLYQELHEESVKAKDTLSKKVDELVQKSISKLPCGKVWNEVSERLARIEKALNIESSDTSKDTPSEE